VDLAQIGERLGLAAPVPEFAHSGGSAVGRESLSRFHVVTCRPAASAVCR
jgi:hypothetical protein